MSTNLFAKNFQRYILHTMHPNAFLLMDDVELSSQSNGERSLTHSILINLFIKLN